MDVGLVLSNAREELGTAEFWKMVRDRLKFSKSMVGRLIAIGTDTRLMEVAHVLLPASWGTLHALNRLTDEQFQYGLDTGIIHAGMERKDVALLWIRSTIGIPIVLA
jgi:hypothetical protein